MKTNIIVFGSLIALAALAFFSMQNANAVAEAKKAEAEAAAQAIAGAQPKPAGRVTAGELSDAVRRNMQDASLSEIAVKFYDQNNK